MGKTAQPLHRDKPITKSHNTSDNITNVDKIKITDYLIHGNVLKSIDERMDNIDIFAEKLRQILNASWGDDWGLLSAASAKSDNSEDITFPAITYDTFHREPNKSTPKPKKFETVKEVINGKETGDLFNVYRQWFDTIIEFNIWGHDALEARSKANDLELLLKVFIGYFKEAGVSEMLFLEEVPPGESGKFIDGYNMKCLMFYVRFEKIQMIRGSKLASIKTKLKLTNDTTNFDKQTLVKSSDIYINNNVLEED
jgi:hypothetical protein